MAARHSVRITQLENEISRLTGRMEEIDFALSRIEARLDKLVVDLDQRLTALEGGQPASPVRKRPCPVRWRPMQPRSSTASATGTSLTRRRLLPRLFRRLRVRQPGVLGTIPKDLAVKKPRGPRTVSSALPPSRPADVPAASVALPAETVLLPRDAKITIRLRAIADVGSRISLLQSGH